MIPATPPSWSIIRSAGVRSTSGVATSPSMASAVSPASVARFTEGASPLNFVVRVVDRLSAVFQLAEPAVDTQRPARLDAGNPALPQPHQLDGVGPVEQFGADTVGATFALAFHAAQRSDHRDLLAALAIDGPLRAGRHRLVAQILGITLLGVLGQPPSQPAQITFRRHGLS